MPCMRPAPCALLEALFQTQAPNDGNSGRGKKGWIPADEFFSSNGIRSSLEPRRWMLMPGVAVRHLSIVGWGLVRGTGGR